MSKDELRTHVLELSNQLRKMRLERDYYYRQYIVWRKRAEDDEQAAAVCYARLQRKGESDAGTS